jgi:hypothetical protein
MAVASKSGAIAVAATSLVASLTAATALAVPPPPSSTFKGKTNQPKAPSHRVRVTTDANGHVSGMLVGWRAKCKGKGIHWDGETSVTGGTNGLPQNGDVFINNGSYTGHASHGITGKITIASKGQFTDNDHANGTWSAKVIVMNKKGKKIDKCKSPKIKWSVKRVA